MKARQERYPNLDILRLFFAFGVVTWHVSARTNSSQFPYPFLAVPSFLAISGFVILKSWRSAESPLHFWIKRATRLLPAFFICFALILVIFGPAGLAGALATYYKVGTMNTMNSVNPPLWTLSAEETIYILFSFCAAFINGRRLLIPVTLAFAGYLYFAGCHAWNDRYLALIPAFLLGLYACETNYRLPLGPIVPTIAACALSVWINAFHHDSLHPADTIAWALWTCCSIFATLELGRMAWQPLKKGITDISYGVYIYHYPILIAMLSLNLPTWTYYISVPALTCAFAYASARLLEQPAIRARKRILGFLTRRSSPTPEVATSTLPNSPELG
jgi:peptidoglycan/LPS O-acetylase OafA/YrhL